MAANPSQYSGTSTLEFSFIFPSPDRKHLAITGEWGMFYPIYLDPGQGQPLSPVLGPVAIFFNWFPDNRHILYRSDSGLLILGDPVSGERSILAYIYGEQVTGAAASPDGQHVIYTSHSSGNSSSTSGLWIINSNGQNKRLLSKEVEFGFIFAWSPDGKRIAFYSGGWNVIDADGSNLVQLTSDSKIPRVLLPQCYFLPPLWSPNSRTLAVVSSSTDSWESFCPGGTRDLFKGNDIYLIDVESGKYHPLLADGSTGNIDPAWSPDGSQIAFVSNRGGSPEIWVVNLDGSNLRQMTRDSKQVRFPVWSGK